MTYSLTLPFPVMDYQLFMESTCVCTIGFMKWSVIIEKKAFAFKIKGHSEAILMTLTGMILMSNLHFRIAEVSTAF